ncbi:hypothetical protein [Nonlabens dokdonensis]|uniref:Uncharacterized protein n=1 Tax=Nonlabens dokdonensis (strain DSM 17205 / KCTC 12402 / DSW-6) TaxID=592029 RepID=L7W7M5_NONDD|nr:hypothetical protein [Nonlabens dokdonensis]AGC76149.1 hypothetical protein DDD_1022 [Nonlabens dokdonensis DSW-6]
MSQIFWDDSLNLNSNSNLKRASQRFLPFSKTEDGLQSWKLIIAFIYLAFAKADLK